MTYKAQIVQPDGSLPPDNWKDVEAGNMQEAAEGDGVSDDHGNWAHEGCQDAEDEAIQNVLDHDPIELEFCE